MALEGAALRECPQYFDQYKDFDTLISSYDLKGIFNFLTTLVPMYGTQVHQKRTSTSTPTHWFSTVLVSSLARSKTYFYFEKILLKSYSVRQQKTQRFLMMDVKLS